MEFEDQDQAFDDGNSPEQIVLLGDDLGATFSHQHVSPVDTSSVDASSKNTPSKKETKAEQDHCKTPQNQQKEKGEESQQ
jgi:hypothetical protein